MLGKLFQLLKKSEEACSNQLPQNLTPDSSKEQEQVITRDEIAPPAPQEENQTIWLLLLREPDSPCLTFYDMCKDTIHEFKLPDSVLSGGSCWCKGSGHGWLALDTIQENRDPQIFLFNPVSGHHIALPPFKQNNRESHIGAIRISSVSPAPAASTTSSFTVATILNSVSLAIWGGSDSEWLILEGLIDHDQFFISDFLFASDGKTLYVSILSKSHNVQPGGIQTHPIRLAGGSHNIVLKILPESHHSNIPGDNDVLEVDDGETVLMDTNKLAQYLVESDDAELFTVYRRYDSWTTMSYEGEGVTPKYEADHTRRFEVGKLEPTTGQVSTLTPDLGDRALFISKLGKSFLISLINNNFKGLERNSIYFLDDEESNITDPVPKHEYSRDSGVFSIKDGDIKRFLPSRDIKKQCFMIWFSPHLKSESSHIEILVHKRAL